MASVYDHMRVLSSERSLASVPFQLPMVVYGKLDLADATFEQNEELAMLMGDGALFLVG